MALGLTYRGADVFAPTDENGTPRTPSNVEAQVLTTEYERLLSALASSTNAAVIKGTLAELNAVSGNFSNGDIGLVITDSVEANRGVYKRTASSWVKQSDLPQDLAQAAQVQAEASAASATQSATNASTAKAGAEAARDIAAGYASDAVSQGNVPIYGTVAGMGGISVPAGIAAVRVNGLAASGDGWEGLYYRAPSEPVGSSPLRKFRSADRFLPNGSTSSANGGWWAYSPRADIKTNVAQFGMSPAASSAANTAALDDLLSSVAKIYEVPEGAYLTGKGQYDILNKRLAGPGQIVLDGKKQAPQFVMITEQQPQHSDDDYFASGFPLAHRASFTFVGDGVNPEVLPDSYTNHPEWSARIHVHNFTAGYNKDAADHALGRSGAFVDVLRMSHGGQGDLVGRSFYGSGYNTREGAAHWLACPAIVAENGNFEQVAGCGPIFLNHSEYVYNDNDNDVSVIDRVRNYYRNNNTAFLSQVWIHDRPQVSGAEAIDAFYAPSGKSNRGLDFTTSDFASLQGAILLSARQRIYYNASSSPDSIGAKWFATDFGQTFSYFDDTDSQLKFVVGNVPTLQVSNAAVYSPMPLFWKPGGGASLFENDQMTFAKVSNTQIAVRLRGSDGVTRTGTITLS